MRNIKHETCRCVTFHNVCQNDEVAFLIFLSFLFTQRWISFLKSQSSSGLPQQCCHQVNDCLQADVHDLHSVSILTFSCSMHRSGHGYLPLFFYCMYLDLALTFIYFIIVNHIKVFHIQITSKSLSILDICTSCYLLWWWITVSRKIEWQWRTLVIQLTSHLFDENIYIS